jgi:two-component system cell cycle sensor histidine kinase/response regulator CckA
LTAWNQTFGSAGGRTFDALRSIDPGVKVILCSGYSADGEARRILNRGCSGFIQKPFRIANFTGVTQEVIEK